MSTDVARYKNALADQQKTMRELERENNRLRERTRTLEAELRSARGESSQLTSNREAAILNQLEDMKYRTGEANDRALDAEQRHAGVLARIFHVRALLRPALTVWWRWPLLQLAGIDVAELRDRLERASR